jgi:hypothetical protein
MHDHTPYVSVDDRQFVLSWYLLVVRLSTAPVGRLGLLAIHTPYPDTHSGHSGHGLIDRH